MIEALTYYSYVAGWAIVRALPERVALSLAGLGADLAVRRRGKGVRQLEANLRRVLGPGASPALLESTLRKAMRSYSRYWIEVFRLPVITKERLIADTTCEDEHLLREAVASGRGVVLALPHQGNWDAAGAWATATGMPFTTVAERLKPERLYDRFVAFRESLGMEVLALTGDKAPPLTTMTERLRGAGTVFLVADRDLSSGGIEVDFFGERTTFPGGPAALALRTGAVCLAATMWFREDGWGIKIHAIEAPTTRPPGGPIRAMTQQIADAFEEGIGAHPQDWHMLQPLWLADRRPPERTSA
ncbi:MAG: phosphatidylinositol mannoside acyltransferase [Actinomycetota bacterium]